MRQNLFEEEFFNDPATQKSPSKSPTPKSSKPKKKASAISSETSQPLRSHELCRDDLQLLRPHGPYPGSDEYPRKSWPLTMCLCACYRAWSQTLPFEVLKQRSPTLPTTTDRWDGPSPVGPCECWADRETTTNLRYKQGRNLNYDKDAKGIFHIRKPEEAKLPGLRPALPTSCL